MKIKGYSTGIFGWQQLYAREGQETPWDKIFRDCAESGLDAVEMDPLPELVSLAQAHGLAVSGCYVGLDLHEPFQTLRIERTVLPVAEMLAKAGGTDLLINADAKGGWQTPQLKNEDEFKRQGDNLTRIAEAVKPLGLKLCMHNHAAINYNAEGDLRAVIDYAGLAVGLCVDTGWAHVAGCDPISWMIKYPERVYAFHLRNQFGHIPAEHLTEGDINMNRLLRVLTESDYEGWLALELWHREDTHPKRTMVEDTRISLEFLKQGRW